MRIQHLPRLILTLLLMVPIVSCSSKPKIQATPSPSPAISITKPINKARDAKTTVEQVGKQHGQLNPEAEPTQP